MPALPIDKARHLLDVVEYMRSTSKVGIRRQGVRKRGWFTLSQRPWSAKEIKTWYSRYSPRMGTRCSGRWPSPFGPSPFCKAVSSIAAEPGPNASLDYAVKPPSKPTRCALSDSVYLHQSVPWVKKKPRRMAGLQRMSWCGALLFRFL